jgi:hypothetical protein
VVNLVVKPEVDAFHPTFPQDLTDSHLEKHCSLSGESVPRTPAGLPPPETIATIAEPHLGMRLTHAEYDEPLAQ